MILIIVIIVIILKPCCHNQLQAHSVCVHVADLSLKIQTQLSYTNFITSLSKVQLGTQRFAFVNLKIHLD